MTKYIWTIWTHRKVVVPIVRLLSRQKNEAITCRLLPMRPRVYGLMLSLPVLREILIINTHNEKKKTKQKSINACVELGSGIPDRWLVSRGGNSSDIQFMYLFVNNSSNQTPLFLCVSFLIFNVTLTVVYWTCAYAFHSPCEINFINSQPETACCHYH